MKKSIRLFCVSLLIVCLLFTGVFAGTEKSGFSGSMIADHGISGLTITPKTAGGSTVSSETAGNVTLYPGSEKLTIAYTGDLEKDAYLIVMLLEGHQAIPKYNNILALAQHTVTDSDVKSGMVTLDAYPVAPGQTTDLTLVILSNQFGLGTRTIPLSYTVR